MQRGRPLLLALAIALALLPPSGCGVAYEKTERIERYKSRKADVEELLGSPGYVVRRTEWELWEYSSLPPSWPLYLPLVNVIYGLFYAYRNDTRRIFRCYFSPEGLVVDKQWEGAQ